MFLFIEISCSLSWFRILISQVNPYQMFIHPLKQTLLLPCVLNWEQVFQQLTLFLHSFSWFIKNMFSNVVSASLHFQNTWSCFHVILVKHWIYLSKSQGRNQDMFWGEKCFVTLLGNTVHWKRTSWGRGSDSLCHSFRELNGRSWTRKWSVPSVKIFHR